MAFNVLTIDETCPACAHQIRRRVQFKYGELWAHEYELGDTLRWGVNEEGSPARLVRVEGVPEACSLCGDDPEWVYDIVIRDNVIESAARSTTVNPFAETENDYIVVEP
ncbi:hypothetical protein ACTI_72400 [Actinoplanes sp. OR16]|uniref:hypothetical protein n=1 Tax=Actinoplanes sp. OR16 TaxID=946334 RepID=UPI000F708B7C|nr:hypothetical protein [Actinoplanes sp. OR16]BBH70555.1 hypothetical protein ACTI_72400 [Actinoplanes sp. OR16]